jgi:hypothetical protein
MRILLVSAKSDSPLLFLPWSIFPQEKLPLSLLDSLKKKKKEKVKEEEEKKEEKGKKKEGEKKKEGGEKGEDSNSSTSSSSYSSSSSSSFLPPQLSPPQSPSSSDSSDESEASGCSSRRGMFPSSGGVMYDLTLRLLLFTRFPFHLLFSESLSSWISRSEGEERER